MFAGGLPKCNCKIYVFGLSHILDLERSWTPSMFTETRLELTLFSQMLSSERVVV